MYNSLKSYNNKVYTGMKIGGTHQWNYNNGKWVETKISPEEWNIKFTSVKTRMVSAPTNTGASIGTKFHWYIIADQIATKMDSNSYNTVMKGVKFKVGHKRPHWRTFSYNYPEQMSYKERIISLLENYIEKLKDNKIEVDFI